MTIQDRINEALRAMEGTPELHIKASNLKDSVEKLIQDQLIAHLGEIDNQMPEYDKHDRSHSEKVLDNIEKLLLDKGIGQLSFLEALVLRLCCYFHDAGMILPQCYGPLMERVEQDLTADPLDGIDTWLTEKNKSFDQVKEQFYCPDSAGDYVEFLVDQLAEYQKYCQGLPEKPEGISDHEYFKEKRHDYLRSTHGDRVRVYSQNLASKFLNALSLSDREDLQKAVGDICASHCDEIKEVKKLATKLELLPTHREMTCNVRYMAMLLRLGDVLHFSSDRVSATVYAERDPMGPVSDRHWMVKLGDLSYTISTDPRNRKIVFNGSFDDPKSYYFLQDHLNWMDAELENYAYFVSDMHGEPEDERYALGLPTAVDRSRVRARGFTPDQDLKFKLEHQKIIQLLMGMRLYRDEFMCLRELYQNALDACRCMRAEYEVRRLRGDLEIEFGLGTDEGGDYLYCKDQGTGMTVEIVKSYLLRIGNSYYQSAEFRRKNAGWGGKVAPVSEFGIGLLSCYMIASRIEVITRHYTKSAEAPIWISMECSDDYGYFKTPHRREENWVGDHGTVVKLYLMDKYKPMVKDYIPDNIEDAIYMLACYDWNRGMEIKQETKDALEAFRNSLYHRIQQFVHIPESGIPVRIRSTAGDKRLFPVNAPYNLAEKLPVLLEKGIDPRCVFGEKTYVGLYVSGKWIDRSELNKYQAQLCQWMRGFACYTCSVTNAAADAGAFSQIHLPQNPDFNNSTSLSYKWDVTIDPAGWCIYIDGMPVKCVEIIKRYANAGIQYAFNGKIRPRLTVDRGEIRDVSAEVKRILAELEQQMQEEVVAKIREHFAAYPEALTQEAKSYLVTYLFHKYDDAPAMAMVRELSGDILADNVYYGTALHDWFHKSVLELPSTSMAEDGPLTAYALLYHAMRQASSVRLENGKLLIQTRLDSVSVRESRMYLREYVVRADNWPEAYQQYDAVRSYAGLVPDRVFRLIPKESNGNDRVAHIGYCPISPSEVAKDPVRLVTPDWQDVLLALQEKPGSSELHNAFAGRFGERGDRRYVQYIFINPRPLNDDDEAFLQKFCAHVPQYREGVEKGWSILFYDYKNGYVIAPGIVDRQEMLKLLPQEALNHDDGLEYYFTDGTFAF